MATRVYKTDATYELSRTFYDDYQRKCGKTTDVLGTIAIPDRTYAFTNYVTGINWALSNAAALTEIPDFAVSYSINITRCLRTRFFLQLRGADATYAVKQQDGTYTLTTATYLSTSSGCAFDISTLQAVNMGYSFTAGDIVKIYIGANVYSLSITGQQGSWIITELQNLGNLDASTLFLFEIYTPYKPSTSEPAYEVGQIFPIFNPGTGTRAYSMLSGIIPGDVWLLSRIGVNNFLYQIIRGAIFVGQHTVGVNFISQDVPDSNVTTGNSPLQSLAGFDITTNNDRWIQKIGTLSENFKISGILNIQVTADTTFLLYLDDNNNNVRALVNQSLTTGIIYNIPFDVNYTGDPNTRIFILAKGSESVGYLYNLTNFRISSVNNNVKYTVEAMSPNDKFYQNWFTDAGRPNFTDTIGQVELDDDIPFSNTFIAGSKVNGLSTYDALDTVSIPQECGPIQKLQIASKVSEEGAVMLIICRQEAASQYLGEVQVVAQAQNAFLSSAPNVLGTLNILKGSYGTRNPESVQEFKGNVYWLSADNGKYVQYGPNGLFPVSNYKLTKFWKLFSETYLSLTQAQIEAFGSRPFVFTGIDPHNGELLVSVPQVLANPPKGYLPDYPGEPYPFDIWDGRAKSVVFKLFKDPNYWGGAYNIPAENFIYAGNSLYAMKNGTLYQLNSETTEGNFFGTQYQSSLMYAENQDETKPKAFNNIALEASKIPIRCYFRTEEPDIQASDLKDFDPWEAKEGVFYCYLYRDKLTPGPLGPITNALLLGDQLRSTVLLVMLTWDAPIRFRFVSIGYEPSLGHTM